MADILSNSSTSATIGVGQTITNELEAIGDHDWFRITLTAGQSISVALDIITLEDPYLRIRDSSGQVIYENDDTRPGIDRGSLLAFTANYTGTYYIDVGAWDENYTGSYSLSVSPYAPPPVATFDQVADQLVEGYWDGNDRHFNVTQGGTLNVNLTGLTVGGVNLARQALALWSDIIGVTFQEVSAGGHIVFDDNEEGAFSTSVVSNHIISSSKVNVSTQWLTDYGTGLTSYSFQTYIHEIGHALGLGHGGNYNETARYPFDANFLNDSWAMTIMSYFDQEEATYFGDQGFTQERIVTPMGADILAMSVLYGLSTTTRTGDTTYGYNSTADRAIYNANQYPDVAYTIYDSGGTDTIDMSGASGNQQINLNPETFSNVGAGNVGNLGIARGVVIENAIGGSAGDTLTGNAAGNVLRGNGGDDFLYGNAGNDTLEGGAGQDSLSGGFGNDVFRDTRAGLNGDTITDFGVGDTIVFSDAMLSGFTFNLSGNILSFSGGSLTFSQTVVGSFVAAAASGGGVQLSLVAVPVGNPLRGDSAQADFNGDGRDDILWRHDGGAFSAWQGQADGSFTTSANSNTVVAVSWHVAGTGDFNGDGRGDVVWRSDSGAFSVWNGLANGGFVASANSNTVVSASWRVVASGDFNGDNYDDVVWRNDSGAFSVWSGRADGGFAASANSNTTIGLNWTVAGAGDFNGDGRDDVLWRSDSGAFSAWLGQSNGGFAASANSNTTISTSWSVAGAGDFNGDGRDDVLWVNSSGAVSIWHGLGNGGFVASANSNSALGAGWDVDGVGDFNGDGRDDILWRHSSGSVAVWHGQLDGSLAVSPNSSTIVATSWHIQPQELF